MSNARARRYCINCRSLMLYQFYRTRKKLCLNLDYNESSIYLFVNEAKIYQFQVKDSELNACPVCLGNISKDFSNDNMKQTGANGCVYDFLVDFGSIDVGNILDIHKYLMKKYNTKLSKFIKKMFIGLLSACTIVSFDRSLASNPEGPMKCVSLNNQPCQGRPTIVDLNANETLLYPYTVSFNECGGNTFDDPILWFVFQIKSKT